MRFNVNQGALRRIENLRTLQTERGAIVPLVAVAMVVLLGAAGLSLDIGYLVSARHDLENAADSSALAGARHLTMGTVPNFTEAATVASSMVTKSGNTVVGNVLSTSTVKTGGWDLTGTKTGLQTYVAGGSYAPAVEVRIQMTGTTNGAVPALFSKVFGFKTFDSNFTAVAVGDISPSVIDPGQLLPLAMSQCMFDKFWDPIKQGPKMVPSNYDSNYPPCPLCETQTKNAPYAFKILSDNTRVNANASCSASGQWTSFEVINNGASYMSGLISGGNPTSLCISGCGNSQIWLDSGTQTTLYHDIELKLGAAKKNGSPVPFGAFVPVVTGDVTRHDWHSLSAFACVKVTAVDSTSNDKWVQMEMLPVSTTPIMGLANSPFVCQIKGSGAVTGGYLARPPGLVNYMGDDWE